MCKRSNLEISKITTCNTCSPSPFFIPLPLVVACFTSTKKKNGWGSSNNLCGLTSGGYKEDAYINGHVELNIFILV